MKRVILASAFILGTTLMINIRAVFHLYITPHPAEHSADLNKDVTGLGSWNNPGIGIPSPGSSGRPEITRAVNPAYPPGYKSGRSPS